MAAAMLCGPSALASCSQRAPTAAALRAGARAHAAPRRGARAAPAPARAQYEWREEGGELEYLPMYPDPRFIAETLEAFPDKMAANAEEARALISEGGYTYLDVRSALEVDEVGRVRVAVNIPYVNCAWKYDPEARKKNIVKTPNEGFLAAVQKKFPDPAAAKLVVGCSDGKKYSIDVLEALDEAGYENLVLLKGGYPAWNRKWDLKMNRRVYTEFKETYTHDGDSCGIHASGAGFVNENAEAGQFVPPSIY